jgi:hypothetical protein
MKTAPARPINITTLRNIPGATKATAEPTKDARFTLRVEDGMLHINNISGKPEGITYTLMAQASDGTTTLIARYATLAPFQIVEDQIEGMNVLAAWAKN